MERLRDSDAPAREQWAGRAEFLLSCLGYAVGIGNVWRFPYLCYKNGGGAFLFPYLVALALMGAPLFLMEISMGQLFKQGTFHSMKNIDARLRGIGTAACLGSFTISVYYNVLIAWSIVYFVASFWSPLPWEEDSEHFWSHDVLRQSQGFYDQGDGVSPYLLVALLVAWIAVYLALKGGIKGSGKVVWVTATTPYVFLVILFFRAVTLEGAGEGIKYYLQPDWSKLADPAVWSVAASQIFYSLGVCAGTLTAFGSYNKDDENVVQDTIFISLANSFTSIFAGFGVFSMLGHLAHEQGVAVADVVSSGEGLAFVVYPQVLASLPGGNFFAVCFFLMLIGLGIDSQLAMVEVMLTLAKDFGSRWSTKATLRGLCVVSFLLGLPFVFGSGIYWFQLVDTYCAMLALFIVGIGECLAISHLYGGQRFANEIEKITGVRIPDFVLFLWKWVTPIFIAVLVVAAVVDEATGGVAEGLREATLDGEFPPGAHAAGLFVCLLPVACIVWAALVEEKHISIPLLGQRPGAEVTDDQL